VESGLEFEGGAKNCQRSSQDQDTEGLNLRGQGHKIVLEAPQGQG